MLDNHESASKTVLSNPPSDVGANIGRKDQAPPLRLFRIDFDEMYDRHLCRHGQFGINVLHLLSVVITYVAVIKLISQIPRAEWILGTAWISYNLLLAVNLRAGMLLLANLGLAALVGISLLIPPLPLWLVWVYPLAILASHRFQLWSHKVYTDHKDMSRFQKKYPKGRRLFVVLMIYELPILLNFFRLNLKQPKHASSLKSLR